MMQIRDESHKRYMQRRHGLRCGVGRFQQFSICGEGSLLIKGAGLDMAVELFVADAYLGKSIIN